MKICIDVIKCRGHPNIQATHSSTLEFEEKESLTPRGDCIVCISCSKITTNNCHLYPGYAKVLLIAMQPLPPAISSLEIHGRPSLDKTRRLIIRKSTERKNALLIQASKAARDIPLTMKKLLQSPFTNCIALYASLNLRIDSKDVLPRSIIENPPN